MKEIFDTVRYRDWCKFDGIDECLEVMYSIKGSLNLILFIALKIDFPWVDRPETKFEPISNQTLCIFNLPRTIEINIDRITEYKIWFLCIYGSW